MGVEGYWLRHRVLWLSLLPSVVVGWAQDSVLSVQPSKKT